jgi:hypothetical protein
MVASARPGTVEWVRFARAFSPRRLLSDMLTGLSSRLAIRLRRRRSGIAVPDATLLPSDGSCTLRPLFGIFKFLKIRIK